jgi:hypothetical protein
VFTDAKETAQQKCHAALRDMCAAGDVSLLKSLLQQLGSEAEQVVNIAPSGSNTLLFMWVILILHEKQHISDGTSRSFCPFVNIEVT